MFRHRRFFPIPPLENKRPDGAIRQTSNRHGPGSDRSSYYLEEHLGHFFDPDSKIIVSLIPRQLT
jgi:hypothetical protein